MVAARIIYLGETEEGSRQPTDQPTNTIEEEWGRESLLINPPSLGKKSNLVRRRNNAESNSLEKDCITAETGERPGNAVSGACLTIGDSSTMKGFWLWGNGKQSGTEYQFN